MTDLLAHAAGAVDGSGATDTTRRVAGRRIVVAVDGSPASIEALRWANDEVLQSGDALCVVTAFHPPQIAPEAPALPLGIHETAECARVAAEEAIRTVFGPDEPGRSIDHVVAPGSIERLAGRHSIGAALLVFGTRPRRRLLDRVQPSATHRITGRASCPVVSVPHSTR